MRSNAWRMPAALAIALGLSALPHASHAAPRAGTGPAAAERFLAEGDRLKEAQRLGDALVQYENAVQAAPDHAQARQELGRALYDLGRFAEAAEQFRRLAETAKDQPVAWYNLGYSLRKTGDLQGAAEAFAKYVEQNPDDPDGHYNLAESYRGLRDPARAAAQYELYVEKETRASEQSWVDKARGRAGAMHDEIKAQTVAAAPAPAPATVQSAAPVQLASPAPSTPAVVATPASPVPVVSPESEPAPVPQMAVQASEPAAQGSRDPTAAVYKVREGDALFQQRRYREAIASYEDAYKLDDRSTGALLKMGVAYANQSLIKEALEKWERVLEIEPNNQYARTYIERARPRLTEQAASMTPQPVAAPNVLAASAQPPPTRAPPSAEDETFAREAYRRAVEHIRERRFAESLPEINAALERNPGLLNAYIVRGGAYLALGRHEESIADYNKAVQIGGALANPLLGIARAYEQSGDPAKALAYYQRVLAASDVSDALKQHAERKIESLSAP